MREPVLVNGKKIYIKPGVSSFSRSMSSIRDDIYRAFERIGVTKEYIDLPIPRNVLKKDEPAMISWVVNGQDYFFECKTQDRYIDNLGVISKVIEQESYAIRNGLKSFGQVMGQFRLGWGGESVAPVKTPREVLGIPSNIKDLDYIMFKYKKMAKDSHPDTENGDAERFKEVNDAFEALKKELGND